MAFHFPRDAPISTIQVLYLGLKSQVKAALRNIQCLSPGIHQPLFVSNPLTPANHGQEVRLPASLLDIVPTIMDWHKVPLPSYAILKKSIFFTGASLLSSASALPSNFQLVTNGSSFKPRVLGVSRLYEQCSDYPSKISLHTQNSVTKIVTF